KRLKAISWFSPPRNHARTEPSFHSSAKYAFSRHPLVSPWSRTLSETQDKERRKTRSGAATTKHVLRPPMVMGGLLYQRN
ncbi:MAG: hypothetical protein J6X55_04200, partial [Victivallales bacterium]|nr:hypothetical protein [Victivallales bacterium]